MTAKDPRTPEPLDPPRTPGPPNPWTPEPLDPPNPWTPEPLDPCLMYQLYLNSMSPFSMKASAMIGYAGLPCRVKTQNLVNRFATLQRLTGQTMVPTLRRGEWAIADSSHIAHYIVEHTDRPLLPADSTLAPICWLLEDFADEWVSLWVLGSRWTSAADAQQNKRAIGRELAAGLPGASALLGRVAGVVIAGNIGKGGARAANLPAMERSRDRLLQALESLLERQPDHLFECYPTVADFALFGQLSQYAHDPTGRAKMRIYPNVLDYLARMERMTLPHPSVTTRRGAPRPVGALSALFAEFLGTYWRVLVANHRAYHRDKRPERVDVELLDGEVFTIRPSGYLVGRLEFVLAQMDAAYATRDELFGGQGLEIEHALIQQVASLTDDAAGRDLLRAYPHIAKS